MKLNKTIGFIISGIIILSVIGVFAFFWTSGTTGVKEYVAIEAGTAVPAVEEFLLNEPNEKTAGRFITDISVIDTSKTGETEIELEIGGKKHSSLLVIEDTVPPIAEPVELYIFRENEINPEDLVKNIRDATEVAISFAEPPDLSKPSWQDAVVILTDGGGNAAEIDSRIYIYDVIGELVIEAGTADGVEFQDFFANYTEPNVDVKLWAASLREAAGFYAVWDAVPDFSVPGTYPVTLVCGDYETRAAVIVQDTIPPAAEPVEQYIFKDSELRAEDFVTNIKDATAVTVEFARETNFAANVPGRNAIEVFLTDESGNQTVINASYYLFDVIEELIVEAGTVNQLLIQDFITNHVLTNDPSFLEISQNKNDPSGLSIPGNYTVTLTCGAYQTQAALIIQDTTPPSANIRNARTFKNMPVPAEDFADNIRDVSPVTARYKTQPDFSSPGRQTVSIVLEDAHGNSSEYTAQLNVIEDNTPPVISGQLDRWALAGSSVSYRTDVTVTDDYDENVQLVIDSGAVNINRPGVYTVIYSATDFSGNKTEKRGSVTVYEINMPLVNDMADEILAQIITPNMSQRSKARAIYDWVTAKMKYSAASTSQDIAQRAHDGFTRGTGDCYTYMATSRVLLTRAGIENVIVQRYEGAEREHFWNLVDVGEGWYHFDTCPTPREVIPDSKKFMFTESQAREFTRTIPTSYAYYEYDKSTVPEVVE